ncbi:hypothetical protein V9T40_002222 [Parthenolecanium corni]|uniref:Trimethyllysine dioxygenase, mitochondrial n=1 Tax=Parthenolecanium corni TaxID=536013 RepID=A0AAN9TK50_9HEMI
MEFQINQQRVPINLIWLRNNCRCENCFNDITKENKLTETLLHVAVKHYSIDGNDVHVVWNDDHLSKYDINWLHSQQRPENRPNLITWSGSEIESQISIVESEKAELTHDQISKLVESILQFGVGMVRNVLPSTEATEKICKHIGPIMNTFYGSMWEVVQSSFSVYKDTAYTDKVVGVHTDNTYAIEPAGLMAFHGLEPAQQGGETVLVDGFRAAELLKIQNQKHYDNLRTVPIEWHYNSDEFLHINAIPIINTSKVTGELEQIRYNTYHRSSRAPFTAKSNLDDYYASLKAFENILHDPKLAWNLSLQPGTIIFINNWRLLHGRRQFIGRRRLVGCYQSMNTLLSRGRYFKLIK